ncbi:MAG: hypothetical protein ACI9G1_000786 [Pirellulaceae bacterium]|jgi:hypothetical protein
MSFDLRCPTCTNLLRQVEDPNVTRTWCRTCRCLVSLERARSTALPVGAAVSGEFGREPALFNNQVTSVDERYIGKRVDIYRLPSEKPTAPVVDLQQSEAPKESKPRVGIPWETERKSFTSFYRTTMQLIFKPVLFFERMEPEGKMGSAMIYAVCGSLIGGLFMALIQAAFKIATYDMGGTNEEILGEHSELIMFGITLTQILVQTAFTVMGCTLGLIMSLFMSACVYHVVLWMLKGNNRSFEATFRVVSYVTGATSVMLVVPCLGQLVQSFMGPIYTVVGLKNAHETTAGKAVGAVLIPILAVTAIVVGVVVLLLAIGLIAFASFSA